MSARKTVESAENENRMINFQSLMRDVCLKKVTNYACLFHKPGHELCMQLTLPLVHRVYMGQASACLKVTAAHSPAYSLHCCRSAVHIEHVGQSATS